MPTALARITAPRAVRAAHAIRTARAVAGLAAHAAAAAVSLIGVARAAGAQRAPTASDSALVGRILLAEDRRDGSAAAIQQGLRSADPRIRLIARRARGRIADPRFAARDSLPAPAAPPPYTDPAWRLRYRALAEHRQDCGALAAALRDSVWAVRLRAADLAGQRCAADTALVRTLARWVASAPTGGARRYRGVSWQPASHALVALGRLAPEEARRALPRLASSPVSWLRLYAARAAGVLDDTGTLRRLASDRDDNVKEAAVDGLSRAAGHAADDVYLAMLSAKGYQAVRAAAHALAKSPRRGAVASAGIAAARRLRGDSSETSRDARIAVLERIDEAARPADSASVIDLARDFDCEVARRAAGIATRLAGRTVRPACTPLPIALPPDAVALALGRQVLLRVELADSSGGRAFTVRLRGDVAPLAAARVLALARSGYYDNSVWHRVEPDFVIQGGGPGRNEYVGHPRFIRDELGTLPHRRGTVGMSTRGHDTGDGQWFVNLRDNLRLGGEYTVFGEIVDGMDVVDQIQEGDVWRVTVVSSPPR